MIDDMFAVVDRLSPADRERVLRALRQEALEAEAPGIGPRGAAPERIPLSVSQHRLWLLDQLRPGSCIYNEFAAWHLNGALDVAVLEQALSEILRRHESLRTTFPASGGAPVQAIAAPRPLQLSVVDLARLPRPKRDAAVRVLAREVAHRPFDLARGPLLRVTVIRCAEQEHVLVLTAHHIILDGWSVGVFRQELAQLYTAFRAREPSPLQELPFQYADFTLWQRQRLDEEDLTPQLEYWQRQLSDLPPLTELPQAKVRPAVETFAGGREHFVLPPSLGEPLAAFGRREGATLFMTLLAGFQALVHRYTVERDVPIGTVLAGRDQPGLERLIGFFVNTLVLRCEIHGGLSFRELLKRTRRTAIEAYENRDLPFDHVVEALQPERSLSYNPLFQLMFVLQNTPPGREEVSGLTLTPLEMDSGLAKYDLALSMKAAPRGIEAAWEHNCDLFEAAEIRRMSGHLKILLQGIVDDPDRPISDLPLISNAERQALAQWNATRTPYPNDACIHEIFESQAARSPDAVAAMERDRSVTYRELNRSANQMARYLRALGVGQETLVGIYLPRSIDMLVALLGVLKAGGAYVPLDPAYPEQRLAAMLAEAGAAVLLSRQDLVSRLPPASAPVVCFDSDRERIAGESPENSGSCATPENLAYVIFTSGSTGLPKGVLVSHRNLVHSTAARWSYYQEPVVTYLLLSSVSFDSSVAGIYWTLTQGGTLVLQEEEIASDLPAFCRLVALRPITHLLCIPSLYEFLLDIAEPHFSSLRCVIVAGEPCPPSVVVRHQQVLPETKLFNEYGPTEVTVWSNVHRCGTEDALRTVPVGRPIANTRIHVLDPDSQPVPLGVLGEVCIGGAGVGRGYLNHPALTALKLIPDPFGEESGARLYRTGDLGRHLPDGSLELRGRLDNQVKIRGFRIEPAEVESVLREHPAVGEAAAVVRRGHDRKPYLGSFVTARGDADVSVPELRKFLLERLPEFSVPSEIVVLNVLPKLPNGKVDRAAMETVRAPGGEGPDAPVASWSELERAVASIWKETLLLESVGLNDNFFQIGGDSLSVVRVYNRLRGISDKSFSITDLFKRPTIRGIVDLLGG